jgi:SecA DEAD-like domain
MFIVQAPTMKENTSGIICFSVCASLALLLAVQTANGFQPIPILARRHDLLTSPSRVVPGQWRDDTFTAPSSTTTLRMGIMEDFLSGADKSKRESDNVQYLASLQQRVDRINAMESTVEDLGDDELAAKTTEFQQRLKNGEDMNGPLLEEAFAVVREAAWYAVDIGTHTVIVVVKYTFIARNSLRLLSFPS